MHVHLDLCLTLVNYSLFTNRIYLGIFGIFVPRALSNLKNLWTDWRLLISVLNIWRGNQCHFMIKRVSDSSRPNKREILPNVEQITLVTSCFASFIRTWSGHYFFVNRCTKEFFASPIIFLTPQTAIHLSAQKTPATINVKNETKRDVISCY